MHAENRIEDLYPLLAELVPDILEHAQALIDAAEPGRWKVVVHETSRSVEAQLEAMKTGHSNAPPSKAPHCVRKSDDSPCSMAVDFWIVDAQSGDLAPDGSIVWAVIPCAAYELGGRRLVSGAFFRTIRGGDWPHIEWGGWEHLVDDNGALK